MLVQALSELIVNAEVLDQKISKSDLETFQKGLTKKKRELLIKPNYRLKIVPKVCKAGVKYLKDGSG